MTSPSSGRWTGPTVITGLVSAEDAARAVALGAQACMIGRPCLYGLATAGQAGVTRVVALLERQLRMTMQLISVSTVDELRR